MGRRTSIRGEKIMEVFAIREKGTDKYLPARWTDKRHKSLIKRGFSSTITTNLVEPRLHFTLIAARNTLAAWLKGEWIPNQKQDDSGEWNYSLDYKDVGRKKENMEIVRFKLIEIKEKSK